MPSSPAGPGHLDRGTAERTGRAGVAVVKVPVIYERGALTLVVSVSDAGVLAGLQLAPAERHQTAPAVGAARLRRP